MCLRTNKGIFRRRGVILLAAHLLGSCLSFFGTATLRWVFWLNEMQSQLATGWGFYCLLPGLDIRWVAECVYLTLWDFFFSTSFCNKWHGTFDLRKDLSCRYKLFTFIQNVFHLASSVFTCVFRCGQLHDSRMGAEVGVHEPELVLSASVVVRLATHALNHNFCHKIQLTHFWCCC